MPGVRAGPDRRRYRRARPAAVPGPRPRARRIEVPPYPVLARDEVRHVGDAVAFVVADTLEQAKDAAEAIAIDWEPLPHVIGAHAALAPGRAAGLAASSRQSRLRDQRSATQARPRRPSRKAAHTVSLTLVNQRLVTNYLDTRGVIAEYDPARDRLTLTLGSQGSHVIRDILVQRRAEDRRRTRCAW